MYDLVGLLSKQKCTLICIVSYSVALASTSVSDLIYQNAHPTTNMATINHGSQLTCSSSPHNWLHIWTESQGHSFSYVWTSNIQKMCFTLDYSAFDLYFPTIWSYYYMVLWLPYCTLPNSSHIPGFCHFYYDLEPFVFCQDLFLKSISLQLSPSLPPDTFAFCSKCIGCFESKQETMFICWFN